MSQLPSASGSDFGSSRASAHGQHTPLAANTPGSSSNGYVPQNQLGATTMPQFPSGGSTPSNQQPPRGPDYHGILAQGTPLYKQQGVPPASVEQPAFHPHLPTDLLDDDEGDWTPSERRGSVGPPADAKANVNQPWPNYFSQQPTENANAYPQPEVHIFEHPSGIDPVEAHRTVMQGGLGADAAAPNPKIDLETYMAGVAGYNNNSSAITTRQSNVQAATHMLQNLDNHNSADAGKDALPHGAIDLYMQQARGKLTDGGKLHESQLDTQQHCDILAACNALPEMIGGLEPPQPTGHGPRPSQSGKRVPEPVSRKRDMNMIAVSMDLADGEKNSVYKENEDYFPELATILASDFHKPQGVVEIYCMLEAMNCSEDGYICLRLLDCNIATVFGPHFPRVALAYGVIMYRGIYCLCSVRNMSNLTKWCEVVETMSTAFGVHTEAKFGFLSLQMMRYRVGDKVVDQLIRACNGISPEVFLPRYNFSFRRDAENEIPAIAPLDAEQLTQEEEEDQKANFSSKARRQRRWKDDDVDAKGEVKFTRKPDRNLVDALRTKGPDGSPYTICQAASQVLVEAHCLDEVPDNPITAAREVPFTGMFSVISLNQRAREIAAVGKTPGGGFTHDDSDKNENGVEVFPSHMPDIELAALKILCNTLGDCDHPGPQPTMAGIDHVGHIEVTEGKDGDVKELIDGKIPEEADAKLNNEEAIKQDVGELPPKTEEGTKGDEAETTTAKVETAKDAQEIPPKGGKETAEAEDSPKLD